MNTFLDNLSSLAIWGMILGTLIPAFVCVASVIFAFLVALLH